MPTCYYNYCFRGDFMEQSKKVLVIELDKSSEFQRLLGGQPQTHGMRSGRVYLPSGQSCGQHSTKDREEILIFLSGQGTLLIGEEQQSLPVSQGKVAYIPPNTIHDVKNTGNEPLIYIYCVCPV